MSNEWIEISAKTVEEAITEGLIKLHTTTSRMEVEVLEKESSGFLGLIGKRDAKIRVRLKEEEAVELPKAPEVKEIKKEKPVVRAEVKEKHIPENYEKKPAVKIEEEDKNEPVSEEGKAKAKNVAETFLADVFKAMNLETEIKICFDDAENELVIDVKAADMGVIIGKRGQTLDSLQYIVSLVVNKNSEEYIKVKLDSENYRVRRKETLENLAKNIAAKVKRTGKPVYLEPMNSFERRIIHSALQNNKDCETSSEGSDPYRKVVVRPKVEGKSHYSRYNKGYGGKKHYNKKPYRKGRYDSAYSESRENADYSEKSDLE